MKYIRQKAFKWLLERFIDDRVLIVVGARQVGKSTLMKQFQEDREKDGETVFYLTLEQFTYRELLDKNPDNLFQIIGSLNLKKRTTVIIDEIQYLKDPTHVIKYLYDSYKENLKLIVTGSSAFYIDEKFKDSLAGRKYIYEMQSLDFDEFLMFKNHPQMSTPNGLVAQEKLIPLFYEYLTYGGYPAVVLAETVSKKRELLQELAESYTKKDILDYHVASQENYLRILKLLSHQVGSLLNLNSISNQLDIPRATVERYIHIMEKSFHIVLLNSFFNNKKKEIKKMPKAFFYDTGLRNFFANNFDVFDIRIDKGMLLENIAYRALLSAYPGEDIAFWRTGDHQEVDFIIGEKQAYEVKVNKSNAIKDTYKGFIGQYPNIPLSFINAHDCVMLFLKSI